MKFIECDPFSFPLTSENEKGANLLLIFLFLADFRVLLEPVLYLTVFDWMRFLLPTFFGTGGRFSSGTTCTSLVTSVFVFFLYF